MTIFPSTKLLGILAIDVMKICLINPEGGSKGLNVGLAYLSAYILQDPWVKELKVIDLNNWRRDFDKILKSVASFDVIGLSILTATSENAARLTKKIKLEFNNKLVIVGGAHISVDGKNYLKDNPQIDFGFIGEADITIKKFLNYLGG